MGTTTCGPRACRASRIPFVLRDPERFGIQKGLVSDAVVCLEDIVPTVLDMAGVEIPDTVEGKSLLPLMRGETESVRPYLHLKCRRFQEVTDGKEKYAWFATDGREQFFDLRTDPTECHDRIHDLDSVDRAALWRDRLIGELVGRSEGFTDGKH